MQSNMRNDTVSGSAFGGSETDRNRLIECIACRRVFASIGNRMCLDCIHRLDDLYVQVRTLVRDNDGRKFTPAEAADLLDVSRSDVELLVRLGRLDLDVSNGVDFSGLLNALKYEASARPSGVHKNFRSVEPGKNEGKNEKEDGDSRGPKIKFGHNRERDR